MQGIGLIHLCCSMITPIVLANTSVASHNYHFFFLCVVRTLKIKSFSNFGIYNTRLLAKAVKILAIDRNISANFIFIPDNLVTYLEIKQ